MQQEIIETLTELAKCPITPGCYKICGECQFKTYVSGGHCKEALFHHYMNSIKKQSVVEDYNSQGNLEQSISNTLSLLGFPSHLRGYKYTKEAIILVINDPNIMDSVCGKLYPTLADIFSSTPSKIERGIRHAIESAWLRGDLAVQHKFFGNSVDPCKGKPTNSEFIATIADKLRMENKGRNT